MDANLNVNSALMDELEAIQAIYCKPEEFICLEVPEGKYVTIRFDINQPLKEDALKGGVHFLLPSNYPKSIPKEINVFCDDNIIPSSILNSFAIKMKERALTLKGEPILLDLLCFAQELFETSVVLSDKCPGFENLQATNNSLSSKAAGNLLTQSKTTDPSNQTKNHSVIRVPYKEEGLRPIHGSKVESKDTLITTVLQLDHMRSKQNYVKLIQKWTAELGLNGRLLFYGRFIFIILQGQASQVKEYIIRNKTMIVDVDSKGRPCKERMLSVLCEVLSKNHIVFKEFTIVDSISNFDDFSAMFHSFSMMDVFKEYIEPVCSIKSKKSPHKK